MSWACWKHKSSKQKAYSFKPCLVSVNSMLCSRAAGRAQARAGQPVGPGTSVTPAFKPRVAKSVWELSKHMLSDSVHLPPVQAAEGWKVVAEARIPLKLKTLERHSLQGHTVLCSGVPGRGRVLWHWRLSLSWLCRSPQQNHSKSGRRPCFIRGSQQTSLRS